MRTWCRDGDVVVHYIVIKYTSYDTAVFDYIQFSKFHTHNGDDTLPRFRCIPQQVVLTSMCIQFNINRGGGGGPVSAEVR